MPLCRPTRPGGLGSCRHWHGCRRRHGSLRTAVSSESQQPDSEAITPVIWAGAANFGRANFRVKLNLKVLKCSSRAPGPPRPGPARPGLADSDSTPSRARARPEPPTGRLRLGERERDSKTLPVTRTLEAEPESLTRSLRA